MKSSKSQTYRRPRLVDRTVILHLSENSMNLVWISGVRADDRGRVSRGRGLQLGAVGGQVARHVQRRGLAQSRRHRRDAAQAPPRASARLARLC